MAKVKLPTIKADLSRHDAMVIAIWHQDKADQAEGDRERERHELIAFRLFKFAHGTA